MTLQRVLEPEVMDTQEEAVDYNAMDHSTVNRVFVDDLLNVDGFRGDVLDLGTGTALIPIELCERFEDCRVMAVDMAAHMLDLAKYNLEMASLTERIELSQVDAKGLDYDDDAFDAVISNSIVHHIPDPIDCLREMQRILKPGGFLFVRDLLRPESPEQVEEIVQAYAGNDNEEQRQLFRQSLHAALSPAEMVELMQSLGWPASTVEQTSDRHWTVTATGQ